MKYQLTQGHRYRAHLDLGFFERVVSDAEIADRLRDAGFVGVNVDGTGEHRTATGVWVKPSDAEELPSEVVDVVDITTP